jgi:hypothetical protein
MKIEVKITDEAGNVQQYAVSGSLPSINIDKVPIYLKDLFDYCRSKNIEIDDEQVIKKLWYEYDVECYLSRGNDR